MFINLANSALNAAPFSLNGQSQPKPSSDRANFGANIGGPMVIPKILNWQRASFYFTYQGSRSRNPYSQVSSVPTLAERNGDFSQVANVIYDPLNATPFPNNMIPVSRFNPAAVGLLQFFPAASYSGIVQNYRNVTSTPNNTNNVGVRLNAPLTNKDGLTFNVQYQNRDSETEQLLGFRDSTTGYGISAATGWSHSFGRRFNNSANLTFSRNVSTADPYFAYTSNIAAELGITGTSQLPITYGPPNISFTNFGSLSDSAATSSHNQTYNFTDNITYVLKKKHNLTFGYLFRRLQQNSLNYQNARGAFSFSGLLTSELSASGQPASGTGYDFADFLLGLPQSSSVRFGSNNNYFRSWSTSAFAQDDFRISRGLSFNFGLRYEYFALYNSQRATINDSQETLSTLAAETGGKAFLDSNDIAAGIMQAQQAMRSYYILGYYTTNNAENGKYRRIQVKLTNSMNAKIEHRLGYYGPKSWGKLNGQDKEQQLKEAISAGDPVTDIPLALQVDYFRVSSLSYFVPVSVKIPGSVIALAAKGGASVTQFDFAGQIQDEQRNVVGNVRDNIKVNLDKDPAAKAGRKNFQYNAGFTLAPGKYHMKFLVRENITGKMGTFEARFVIPDLSAETSGLKLSTIIWSSQREPLKTAVGVAEKVIKKEVAADPLIDGEEKVVPNITHVFRRSQNLYVTFDVYDAWPDPLNAKARKVKVSMSLFNQKGAKAFEVGPLDESQLAATRPETVPLKFQVPLKDLAPGRYVCQINVVDEVGRKFAFPRAPLVVVP